MKFSIDTFFLFSLVFGKGVYGQNMDDLLKPQGEIIEGEFIVSFTASTRRRLRENSFGTSGGIRGNHVSAEAVGALASMIADAAGGVTISNIFTNTITGFSMKDTSTKAASYVAENENVAYVEHNQVITANQQVTWGIDRVDQRDLPLDNAFYPTGDGTGVTAYIVDTGVRISHNEFGDRARWGENTSGDGEDRDCHGHGTHVAGTVGGSIYGVAKNVEIVAVKVLTCSGSGSTTGVIAGVDWVAIDAAAKGKPATANLSLGGGFSQALNDAVAALHNGGVPTVVAAGNDNGNACSKSPASEPDVITVGSTTNSDARSSFSNFGTCVDIFAPGSGITAAWKDSDSQTNTISGTSMASPHVCGGVALLLEAGLEADEIDEEIVSRATDDKVTDPKEGSPNKLLFVGAVGPTNSPTPAPPTPAPTPCISSTVVIEVTTDNYPAETGWTLTNECIGQEQASRSSFASAGTTYSDEECVPAGEYTFEITDSYGDGICCSYGSGSYKVTYDGSLEKEGNEFGSSESTTFGSCDSSTEEPVDPPTDAPVNPPTDAPVNPPTDAPVNPPTDAPVNTPTDAPISPVATSSPVTSPVENCIECSDEGTPWMVDNNKVCGTNNSQLTTKCNLNNWWRNNKFCQLSCFKIDNGYDGDNCCAPPCTECSDEGTPWMVDNDKVCGTNNSQLATKCNSSNSWRSNKYCQNSCFITGYGYDGDDCCTDTDE